MRIAVVGSGIAGLRAAYRLDPLHDVTVIEAGARVGGHAHTVRVDLDDETHFVDTGFIVFNEANYPRFAGMLSELCVATQPSDMSFAVSCARSGVEYRGSARGLIARPANLADPDFRRMTRDLIRFNRIARGIAQQGGADPDLTLADFLVRHALSDAFVDLYLVPLGSAVWSADPASFSKFPAVALVRFLDNHGLLQLAGRPQWRTVAGGSRRYVEAICRDLSRPVRTSSPVRKVVRRAERVEILTDAGIESFDEVIIAVHGDRALELLGDPTIAEERVLGAFAYQANDVTLHTDERMLPSTHAARASWNAHRPMEPVSRATVTYDMNRLQSLGSRHPILVTLNRDREIRPNAVIDRFTYHHPVYDPAVFSAQRCRAEVSGVDRTWYCGAYWGYGFHEDGVRSADWVVDRILALGRSR